MVLKRKRSASELSSSPSSSSTFSLSSPPPKISFTMDTSFFAGPSGRTLKRFRDSRPSQAEVHQRTLNLLYSAQKHTSQAPEQMSFEYAPPSAPAPPSGQQSLHRFWNINSAPNVTQSPPSLQLQAAAAASGCEDCGVGLGGGGGDEMELDGCAYEDHACGACGKNVCFSCSVSNLGEQKRCLQCAGR